jgi:hypothetical protein
MVNYKDKLKKMREQIPLTDEVECKECKKKFYDEFNLLCLATLDYCIMCANRKLDKETIERKYQNVR